MVSKATIGSIISQYRIGPVYISSEGDQTPVIATVPDTAVPAHPDGASVLITHFYETGMGSAPMRTALEGARGSYFNLDSVRSVKVGVKKDEQRRALGGLELISAEGC